MFFVTASLFSFAVIGALVMPLFIINSDNLIEKEISLSSTQKEILNQYISYESQFKKGEISLTDWSKEKSKLIKKFTYLS